MGYQDFIGEIRYFPFDFVPDDGWWPCDGKEIIISQYPALYAVIGTTFGGDGRTVYRLPNLMGRAGLAPLAEHNPPYVLGKAYGHETVTLTTAQLPSHTHQMVRPGGGKPYGSKLNVPSAQAAPGSLALAGGGTVNALQKIGGPNTQLHDAAVSPVGGGESHTNLQPYLPLTAGICYDGVYPVSD